MTCSERAPATLIASAGSTLLDCWGLDCCMYFTLLHFSGRHSATTINHQHSSTLHRLSWYTHHHPVSTMQCFESRKEVWVVPTHLFSSCSLHDSLRTVLQPTTNSCSLSGWRFGSGVAALMPQVTFAVTLTCLRSRCAARAALAGWGLQRVATCSAHGRLPGHFQHILQVSRDQPMAVAAACIEGRPSYRSWADVDAAWDRGCICAYDTGCCRFARVASEYYCP